MKNEFPRSTSALGTKYEVPDKECRREVDERAHSTLIVKIIETLCAIQTLKYCL